MITSLRRILGRSSLYAFNQVLRDRWVAAQAAALPAGSRVLDMGAGSCPYRRLFDHCHYQTQDFAGLNDDQLRYGAYGKIDYRCDAAAVPVEDGCFDAILCTEVLEHLKEPIQVVREMARILRPGGRLILTAPLGSGIHQEPHHYYGGYTPYWYREFLAAAGFDSIEIVANEGSLRFYSQESLRFLSMTRPFAKIPLLVSLLWAPLWLALLPVLGGVVPLVSVWLDRYDFEKRFTIGYHVTAIRRMTAK